MNCLFITHTGRKHKPHLDPSVRYRCYHLAEALAQLGHIADVCHFENFRIGFMDRYDAFIFHKPKFSWQLKRLVKRLQAAVKLVIADYDDLVFDERYAQESPLYLCGRASLKHVQALHKEYGQALRLFSNITASTEPLADCIREYKPESTVHVVHNGLSDRWVAQGDYSFKPQFNQKTIGYFPGTSTHQQDFSVVESALVHFLGNNPAINLLVLGPVTIDRGKFRSDQIQTLPVVAYDQLPAWIRLCWVVIAPLEDTRFNRCKSALKLFETAVWGIPLIATPIEDMKRCNAKVLFAGNEREWLEGFEAMLHEPYRIEIAADLRKWAISHSMAKNHIPRFLKAIEQCFSEAN